MRRILRIRQAAGLVAPARHSCSPTSARQISTRPAPSRSRPTAVQRSPCMSWNTSYSSLRYSSTSSTPTTPSNPTELASAEVQAQDLEADEAQWRDIDQPSTLILPPSASRAPNRSAIDDATYVQAESGEGLEEVGGLEGYFEEQGHWNPSHEIRTFASTRILGSAVLELAARRAVVEALAVRDAGEEGPGLMSMWQVESDATRGAQVTVESDGSAKLAGNVQSVLEGLAGEGNTMPEPAEQLETAEAEEMLKTFDQSWKNVSLDDAALKFAVTKRIYQLTGHQIRDAKLPAIHTVRDLLSALLTPPKPKKVHEQIQAQGILEMLPNVKIWDRRVTPIDHEKATGRWKVIVDELEKRDLPVTGTGGHTKTVELKWLTSNVMSKRKAKKLKSHQKGAAAK